MQNYYMPCTQQDRLQGPVKRPSASQAFFRRSSASAVTPAVDSSRKNTRPTQWSSSQFDSQSQTPSLEESSSPSQQDETSPRTPNSFSGDDFCSIEQDVSQRASGDPKERNTSGYGQYNFLSGDALPSRPKASTRPKQPSPCVAPHQQQSQSQHKAVPPVIDEIAVRSRVARPSATVDVDVDFPTRAQLPAKKAAAAGVVTFNSRCHARRRPCGEVASAAPPKLKRDTDCTDAIVKLIVCFSTKLVHAIWSESTTTPRTSSAFHGAGVLPLRVFIQETLRRSKTSYSTLQVALFYLILLKPFVGQHHNASDARPSGCRALQCGRRMFLTALILASKYLQDRNYSSRAWSKISGLPINEINENERRYLSLIQFNLHMKKETFENWSRIVLTLCKVGKASMSQDFAQESPGSRPIEIPDSVSIASDDEAKSGSEQWWSRQLGRLSAALIADTQSTEAFLTSLMQHDADPVIASDQLLASLDTPPSSPDSASDLVVAGNTTTRSSSESCTDPSQKFVDFSSSPAPISSIPTKPSLPNLPTPQTTPRFTRTLPMPKGMCPIRSRCKDSTRALLGLDRHAANVANLETCPPPQPKAHGYQKNTCSGRREASGLAVSSCVSGFVSSPESMISDAPSSTPRSRSSSVSSSSSVWPLTGGQQWLEESTGRPVKLQRDQSLSMAARLDNEASIPSSYSFYHGASTASQGERTVCPTPTRYPTGSVGASLRNDGYQSEEGDIDTILATLTDRNISPAPKCPAAARDGRDVLASGPGQVRRQKRDRSSISEDVLHHHVRHLLWDEPSTVEVVSSPNGMGHPQDKQLQHPVKDWACLKKPVPNGLHTKRFALCHEAEPYSTKLAARYLRDDVTMVN